MGGTARCAASWRRNWGNSCSSSRNVGAFATKRPSQRLLPPSEDKLYQSLVETGIRGSLAMVAAAALHLDLFSHVHWLQLRDVATGLQLAAPCIALDAGLLLLHTSLQRASARPSGGVAPSADPQQQQQQQQQQQAPQPATLSASLAAAADAAFLHTIRYSLLGAAPAAQQALLESGAQLSEELLARGVLLAGASTWLASRFMEAGVCGTAPLLDSLGSGVVHGSSCGDGPAWLAAAGLCCIMATRPAAHSRGKLEAVTAAREAAAAEAAARRAALRYEPLAVQEAAAAAEAAAAEAAGAEAAEPGAASFPAAAGDAALAARLAGAWLGARFVVGQGALFGAFILTDNLLASCAAGLLMQLVSAACCEAYVASREEASAAA